MFGKKPPALSQSASLNVSTAEEITPELSDALKQVKTKELTPPPAPSMTADSPFSTASQATVSRSTASPAQKPATKRTASDAQPSKGAKRVKGKATSAAASTSGKGQPTLKGFFAPKTVTASSASIGHSADAATTRLSTAITLSAAGMLPPANDATSPPSTTIPPEPSPPIPKEEYTCLLYTSPSPRD